MNKRALTIIAIFLGAVFGGLAYLMFVGGENETPQTGSQNSVSSQISEKTQGTDTKTDVPKNSGTYIDYKEGIIAQTSGTKLLFFHAPWCPQCRALEADIKKSGVPEGVTIFKVDYDSNQALRQQYGVTIQTTLVKVDDDGKLVEKYVAYDEPSLAAVTRELL